MIYAIFSRPQLRLQLVNSLHHGYVRIFFVLTFWISLLAVLIPLDASRSAGELWSQWWVPVLCGVAGMVTALVFTDVPSPRQSICELLSAIFWLYFGLILLSDLFYLWFYATQGVWPFRWAPLQDAPRMVEAFINGQPFLTGRTGMLRKFHLRRFTPKSGGFILPELKRGFEASKSSQARQRVRALVLGPEMQGWTSRPL